MITRHEDKDYKNLFGIGTFGADTNKQINVILKRPNTRVIALIIVYEHGSFSTIKMFKVLIYVVYTIIDKYVCIDCMF